MTAAQHLENFLQLLTAGLLTGAIYGLMCRYFGSVSAMPKTLSGCEPDSFRISTVPSSATSQPAGAATNQSTAIAKNRGAEARYGNILYRRQPGLSFEAATTR